MAKSGLAACVWLTSMAMAAPPAGAQDAETTREGRGYLMFGVATLDLAGAVEGRPGGTVSVQTTNGAIRVDGTS